MTAPARYERHAGRRPAMRCYHVTFGCGAVLGVAADSKTDARLFAHRRREADGYPASAVARVESVGSCDWPHATVLAY